MNKKIMALICIFIISFSSLSCDCEIQASTIKYMKVNTNYIVKDNYGFTKLTINGVSQNIKSGVKSFKFKLKYEGRYVIKTVNKKGRKKTTIFYVDGTKPQIKCVTSGNKVKVTVTDDRKLNSVLLNGKKVKSKFTISTVGSHKIVAKDKAGNKTTRTVKVKKSATQETQVPVVTNAPSTTTDTQTPIVVVTETPVATNTVTSTPPITTDNNTICEHSWSDGVIVENATCTEEGKMQYTCKKCGMTDTEVIPVTEHVYQKKADSKVMKEAATCQHGTVYYTQCQYCGKVGTDTWTASDVISHNHNWKNDVLASTATCQSPAKYYYSCSMCGQVVKDGETYEGTLLDPSNHASQEIHTHEATCTSEGYSIHYCTYCQKEYGERFGYVAAFGHLYDEEEGSNKTVISKPTCTEEGTYQLECAREGCNETSNKIYKTPALSHDYSVQQTVSDATPATDRTYTLVCSRCGGEDGQTYTDIGSHTDHTAPSVTIALTFSTGELTPITTYYQGFVALPTGIQYNDPNTIPGVYINAQAHDVGSGIKSVSWRLTGFSNPDYINDWNETIALDAWSQLEQIGTQTIEGNGTTSAICFASEAYLSLDPRVLGSNDQFVVVRVEDMAGNVSILRSWDLCAY